jgi:hypothetical protein
MLSALRERLQHDREAELPIAAGGTRQNYRVAAEEITDIFVIVAFSLVNCIPTRSTISTHILDTSRGTPASGVAVSLEMQEH